MNPDPAPRYHLVIIGGGTAGLVTAAGASGLGAKVALVERHLLGRDYLNVGCVPSEALIRAARAMAAVRGAAEFGVRASALLIPWTTYTSPEIAHVGLLPSAAGDAAPANTWTRELGGVDRAVLDGEAEGFVRVHVRKGTERLVGATVVAAHAGDLISELTLAMKGGLGLKAIGATSHPNPTQTEAIRRTGDLHNRTRLTPFVKALLRRWLDWQR